MTRLREIEQAQEDAVEFTELRVHGVSGSTPEALLDTDALVQVRGDEVAGFFRPKTPIYRGEALEAYSWGGLTSKSWTRALWVILAPFALMNVAGWMLSKPGTDRLQRLHTCTTALIRLMAMHTTVLMVMWTGQITIEFAAYQCGGSQGCLDKRGILRVPFEWAIDAPGRRLVIGAVVPVLVILALVILGRTSRGRYEAHYPFDDPGGEQPPRDRELHNTFADPTLWKRQRSLAALSRLHVSAALTGVAWLISASTLWLHGQSQLDGPTGLILSQSSAIALLVAVSVLVLLHPHPPYPDRAGKAETSGRKATWRTSPAWWEGVTKLALWVSAVVLTATAVTALVWPAADPASSTEELGRLTRYGEIAGWLTVVAFGIGGLFLIALAVLQWPWRRGASVPSPLAEDSRIGLGFSGWGSFFAVALGYALAVIFLLALSSGAARYLGGRPTIDSPVLYDATAFTALVLLVVTLLPAVITWAKAADGLTKRQLHSEFPDEQGIRPPDMDLKNAPARKRWLVSVRRLRVLRRFVTLIAWPVAPTLVIGGIAGLLVYTFPPGRDWPASLVAGTPPWLLTGTLWLVGVGLPLALFYLVRRSFVSTTTRRQVGVLWDVLTFWPRWFHPFAPPSYGTRAIPELRTRLDVLTSQGSAVVVSAHSQGSIIALAALDGLREPLVAGGQRKAPLDPIALLTHGSPITRLYLRHFPAHMAGPIHRVQQRLNSRSARPRWLNLYRATDPIGGAISGETGLGDDTPILSQPPDGLASSGIENPIPDPDTAWVKKESAERFPRPGDPYPRPEGHAFYSSSAAYGAAMKALREALTGSGKPPTEAGGHAGP